MCTEQPLTVNDVMILIAFISGLCWIFGYSILYYLDNGIKKK